MKSKAEKLLKLMHILSWVVFVGLLIKAGGILISYLISIGNEEVSKNIFGEINLYYYMKHSFFQYSLIILYKVFIYSIEAYIAYLLIKLLGKLNIDKPFNESIQNNIQQISYSIFYLWLLAMIHNTHVQFIGKRYDYPMDLFSSDFIFLAGIIFIFAQIIKRGIELQTENELTI